RVDVEKYRFKSQRCLLAFDTTEEIRNDHRISPCVRALEVLDSQDVIGGSWQQRALISPLILQRRGPRCDYGKQHARTDEVCLAFRVKCNARCCSAAAPRHKRTRPA